ncbi:MAG: hypothetical protein JRJ15_12800 [Deltaproteobacteria bacterium]|nr:hypothetical protein [Deltaproteobacteria bacterium]
MICIKTAFNRKQKLDLSEADIVVTSLGDPDGKKGVLKQAGEKLEYDGVLKVEQLMKYFS